MRFPYSFCLFTHNTNVFLFGFLRGFARNLLTFYSWTGLSRIKHLTKNPFNKLVNILNIFFDVISYADASFSHKDKEEFFRDGVLKHSFERNKPKRLSKKIKMASTGAEKDVDNMCLVMNVATPEVSTETSIRNIMQQINEDTESYDCEDQES